MSIVVNGEAHTIPDASSVSDLVRILGLERAACAVEINKKLVPKSKHPQHTLVDGDVVEVVSLVGGG